MADGTRMQQRRATEAVWVTSDYVLAPGELGVTTDTGIIKIGNGTSPWTELDIAFGSQYLPLLGKAADSELLDGIDSTGFYKIADATTAATGDKLAMRFSDGRLKAATAASTDDVVNYAQWNANNVSQAADITALQTQSVVQSVANRTALLAISTGSLPYGYRVRQTDKGYLWFWDLSAWRYMGNPGADNPWIRLTRSTSLPWGSGAVTGELYGFSLGENSDTALFSWTAGTALSSGNGGRITVTDAGKYKIEAYARANVATGVYYTNLTTMYPGISSTLRLSKFDSLMGTGVPSGFINDFTVWDEGYLAASQPIGALAHVNSSGATFDLATFIVTRIPSF